MISPNAVPPRNSLRGHERRPSKRSPFHDARRGSERSFLPRRSRMPTSLHTTPMTKMATAHCMPGPRANVRRSMSLLLADALLAFARHPCRRGACRDANGRRDPHGLRVAPSVGGGKRFVEASLVPEIWLRAAEAAMTG